MKKITFLLLIVFGTTISWAQNTSSLPKIKRIVVKDASEVTVSNSEDASSSITYNGKASDVFSVEGATLTINGAGEVFVSTSDISQLDVNDASSVTFMDAAANGFEVTVSDAANVFLSGQLNALVVDASDVCSITINGEASSMNANVRDNASLSSEGLTVQNTIITTHDNAHAVINDFGKMVLKENDNSSIQKVSLDAEIMEDTTFVKIDDTEIQIMTDGEDSSEEDEYIYKDDEKGSSGVWKKGIKLLKQKNVWAGLELSLGGFGSEFGEFNVDQNSNWRVEHPSLSVHLNLFEHRFKLGTEHLKIVTGLGFQWDHIRFEKDVTLSNTVNGVVSSSVSTGNYKKNYLILPQMTVPLLVNINFNPAKKNVFHIDAGLIGGLRFKQKHVVAYKEDYRTSVESSVKSTFNQNPFNLGATLRVGIGQWSLFGIYSLNHLYKENRGPEWHVWNIGITVIPF